HRLGVVDDRVADDQRFGVVRIGIVSVAEPVAHAVEAPQCGADHHGGGVLAPHVIPVAARVATPGAVIPVAVMPVVIIVPVLPVLAALVQIVLALILPLVAKVLPLIHALLQILRSI